MGKASRKKQLDEQRKQIFALHGDGRGAEDRANARAMLDALQRKLEDDALREDGFYFVDGKFVDSRRPRLTSGMKTRGFETHRSSITDVSIVRIAAATSQRERDLVILFTFGLDCVSIWNLDNGKMLGSLDASAFHARSLSGGAAHLQHSELDTIVFAFATSTDPLVHCFDYQKNDITPPAAPAKTFDVASNYCTGHQQAISSMTFSHSGEFLATSSWDSTFHEEGASCLAFTADDQALVTCGECVVKLWDISDAAGINGNEDGKSFPLGTQLQEWQQAIPFSFSIESSTNVFAFDESMAALVANHAWLHVRDGAEMLTLLAPAQSESERTEVTDIKQCLDFIIDEIDPNEDEFEKVLKAREKGKRGCAKSEGNNGTNAVLGSENDPRVLSPEESVRLKTQFRKMGTFDFERLFTPALSLSLEPGGGDIDSIPAKSVSRPPSRPDANGRLLRTFSKCTKDGVFSSHSSTITGCAVAQELDLVVTVALDKTIRYWSLEQGVVLEAVFNAHDAPITCCALTSPTICDVNAYETLLATGGSDNLVKVWRRKEPKRAECVFSLAGHYDAIKSLGFDPSGVFLISSSEDTTAIVWRVRPSSPDQPEIPIVVSVDRFSIHLSWTEPLANGAKILHYVVRTKQVSSFTGDGSDIVALPDTDVPAKYLSKTVDKLQPGVQYTLQVAAVNEIGTSDWSAATEPIETLAFIPSRIAHPVQHDKREASRITLSWTAPCPNGAAIVTYTIQCRPENSAFVPLREVTIPVAELKASHMLPANAEADTRHSTVALKTMNANARAAAPVAVKRNKRSTKPDHVERTASTQMFRLPATVSKRGSVSKTASAQVIPPPSAATLSYTVEELWAGEVYQFVVAAANRCGLGAFSRVSEYVKMDCMAPEQPDKPEIVGVEKRQLDVQWEKPRCNGSEVLQYTLRWRQEVEGSPNANERTVVLLTRSIAGTKYTVAGLEPGNPVQMWVSASNLVDNKLLTSLESLPSDSVATLCDVPDTPAAPDLLDPSAHTLTLAWTPPKRNGLPIDAYTVALYSEDTQFGVHVRQLSREFTLKPHDLHHPSPDSRSVEILLRHLRGDTFYSATVSATNSLGTSGVSVACVPIQTRGPTVPDAVPDAPTVADVTPTSALVTWKLPAHDGGAALRGFHVEYTVRSNRSDHRVQEKMESGGDVTVSHGLELSATFLKPHRAYRFRVSPENRVGRARPSAWSEEVATPSLVEFTVTRYFAYRPPEEHDAARSIQRRYRAWRRAAVDEARFTAALVEVLRHWHL
ncbi:WD repeat-containing protein [Phytophthora pseudosyringae]|uniref:WD repeat-containing protein n=1 Tax=Phytophthora pseudosyringae TaxID=221518 RepID=A0A8T1VDT7_9STRA|nr:WD repeat-containing protein [Phytophthora pseudosyringae]